MKNLEDRIASLSPEQRAVFEALRKTAKKEAQPSQPGPIPRREPGTVPPLSFDQERLWFLQQLEPASSAYNIFTVTRMEGPLDFPALLGAFQEIVRRHEAWRTTFPDVEGKPVQRVAPSGAVPVPVIDLRAVPPAIRGDLAISLCRAEAARPFDLEAGPLLRSQLVRVEEQAALCMLSVHHIVTDWVSFQLYWRELAALYVAFAAGQPSPLPELPVQYGDFVLWQRQRLSGEPLDRLLEFWTQELAGASHVLALPTDRPRPPAQTVVGGAAPVALTPTLSEALRALGRKEGATPFMTVLAVWNALLARYTGEPKILVGSPNANRNRVELEQLFGFFLTQLVFATDVSGDPPFRELLRRARRTALAAYAHQELPFGKLVDAIRPERDASRAPLVQVNILLLDAEYTSFDLPDLQITDLKLDDGISRFDVTLGLFDGSAGIAGKLEYNRDLFDPTTMARMSEAFGRLVEGVTEDPERPLSTLPLLSPGARHQLLAEWNGGVTAVPEAAGETVAHRFAAVAAAEPGAVALAFRGEEIAYGELAARAEGIARALRAAGVGAGSPVGLLAERTPAMVAGLLGIFRAGGAFVPLDPAYPEERLTFLLADAGAEVVLAGPGLAGRLPAGPRVVDLEAALGSSTAADPGGMPAPADLAYVIHTSGTTGQPKGVAVAHASLAAILAACRAEMGFGPGDRMPCLAPFSFDIFLFELLSPLLCGGTVELIPLKPALDLGALLESLKRATRLHAVPALMRQVVEAAGAERAAAPWMRTVFVGGDAVPADLLADLARAFPRAEVRVLYGPTEGTILASSWKAAPAGWTGPAGRRVGTPLGRPLPGVMLRLFDGDGGVPPIGVPGEIHLGGPGVARGYLHRPELSAERFVLRDGVRFYRTGDLARHLPDGTLEFWGRADGQVKVRGFRIEPGEIEAVLLAHPAVAEAAVVARAVAGGDKRLVAYVAGETGARPDGEALRRHLAASLPEHMIPALFVALPALPLTAHGKVDRRALPEPEEAPRATAGGEAPRNAVEETLAEIWRQVLGRPAVGIHDNFFALGGDSILSIQMVVKARQAGLALTPRHLFEHQTVARLAAVATPVAAGGTADDEAPIVGDIPLTPVQRAFFARADTVPGAAAGLAHFDDSLLLRLARPVAPAVLAAAVGAVGERHAALRLRFHREDGEWRQRLAPAGEVRYPLLAVDLGALPPNRRREALEAACAALQTGLDLARGPLFVTAAFDLGGGERRFFGAAHHLVMDAVSWRILLADLEAAIAALEAGSAPALPPEGTSFGRWAGRLAASADVRAELPYWRQALAGAAPALAPVAPAAGVGNTYGSMGTVLAHLTPEVTEELLRRAGAAYRAEVAELLVAGLARAVGRVTGAARFLVALESHGRFEERVAGADLSRTVGWFTAVYPVAVTAHDDLGELLRSTKEALRTVPGHGLGHGLLAGGDEALAAAGEPELVFNYLGQVDAVLGGASLFAPAAEDAGARVSPLLPRSHRLEVGALVYGGRLELALSYSENLDRRETVEALAAALVAALAEIAGHCGELSRRGEIGGYTAADFPLAHLTRAQIDELVGRTPGIEDIFPLAPLQGGMLFHSLLAPRSGDYFQQFVATLSGPLDAPAFHAAWQAVVDRHAALRTAFRTLAGGGAFQVVFERAAIPWREEDWSGSEEVEARLEGFLAADRAQGFDFSQAPLLRLALLATGPGEHRLVWSVHHVLFDGWCFAILLREAFALYEANVAGRALDLGPAPPYRTYMEWLAGRDREAGEQSFRELLAGFEALAPLPADRAGSGAPGPLVHVALSEERTAALAAVARGQGVTLNTLVQGALALFLARETGRQDVLFGMVAAGRPAELPGVEGMVGLFINTLPLRLAIDPRQPFERFAAGIQERQVALREHEWMPLNDIQRALGLPGGTKLFDTLLAFENYPLDRSVGTRIGELAVRDSRLVESTGYPLTVTVHPGAALDLALLFDDSFSQATAERLRAHLAAIVDAIAEGAKAAPLSELPTLPAAERHQLLLEWNDTAPAPATGEEITLADLFLRQAAATPGATALTAGAASLTYAELAARAERLAGRLRALGVGPEVRVGLSLPRSLELVVATLAVTLAGGAFVTLDPSYPRERLSFMLADAGAAVLIVPEGTGALPGVGPEVTLVTPDDREPAPPTSPAAGNRRAMAGNLAYLIYTSGSTGRPKGVAIEHRSTAALLAWGRRAFSAAELAGVVGQSAVSFDMWLFELFAPLTTGGRLILAANLLELPGLPAAAEATLVTAVPAVMAEFLRDGALPPSVETVILGGEVLPRALADRVYAQPGVRRLINAYGPSEDTTYSTTAEVAKGDAVPPSVGRPVTGSRAHLLDADLRPAPLGAPAELYLAGAGLARGYFDRPDLTAERFVPDPLAGAPGGRAYRTGDLARYRPDGEIEYLGRIDQQVKLRGFRIELTEIEEVLKGHPKVWECAAVVAGGGAAAGPRLVAFVVARPGERPAAAELLDFLKDKLPAPMLPAAFLDLPELPLSPNGKVDRRALAERAGEAGGAAEHVAPRNAVEEQLAASWRELLGIEKVSVTDDFFLLGGHSLLATQLASRIQRELGVELPIASLFELRTIEQQAREVLELQLGGQDAGSLDDLLGELDDLSEEEALALLAAEEEAAEHG